MEIQSTNKKGTRRVSVDGEATVYGLAEATDALRAALAEAQVVEVDLSKASEIDSAFAQLLLAAQRQSERDGKRFEIIGHGHLGDEFLLVLSAIHHDQSLAHSGE